MSIKLNWFEKSSKSTGVSKGATMNFKNNAQTINYYDKSTETYYTANNFSTLICTKGTIELVCSTTE